MKKIEIEYGDLVYEDKELGEIVDSKMEHMDIDEVMDCIIQIFEESEKEEPGKLSNAIPLYKLTYIAREMYKYGFASALYLYNESMKEFFERQQR